MIRHPRNFLMIPVNYPQIAGAIHTLRGQITLTDGVDVSEDIIEIVGLPLRCKLIRARFATEGITESATVDVGFITGDFKDTRGARTLGTELIDGGANDTEIEVPLATLIDLAPAEVNRGIGVNFSADISGADTKKVFAEIMYHA